MDLNEIFEKWKLMRIISDIKRKSSDLSSFQNSQFYQWLNNDKKWLKDLIKAEKSVEKLSKRKLWNRFSKFHWDYLVTNYFVNFQYFVELLNVYGSEIWLTQTMLDYNNDWWDDLYISLRLSLMWHYKSSFFHLRSFMENYFQMIWDYSIKVWKVDTTTKEFLDIKDKVKPKFRYLTSNTKNKKIIENNINLDYLFDWEEYAKIYDYLSKFTHNKNKLRFTYSETINFNDEIFEKYMRLSWLVMFLTIRVIYWFMEKEIESQWLKPLQKPIPGEMNYYRYPIWEMIFWDMFYELYEDKINREFLKNEVKIDAEKLYPRLKETIKDLEMYDKLRKQAKWDHDKFLDLVFERRQNK